MKRFVLYLVLLGILLFIVKAIAPLVILGVVGLVLLAWKRPDTVSGLAARPQLARVPASMRATPMRFAGSVGFASFVLIGLTLPLGATSRASDESSAESPTVARASVAPSSELTERPTTTPPPTPVATPVPGSQPTGPTETATVINIVDGDTIDVLVDGAEMRVRYIGMDTPEVHSGVEWMGAEASAANARLVEGKEVVLEKDVSETDQFGRALRYVWVQDGSDWLMVNLELIRLGFAAVATYPPDVKYTDTVFLRAQNLAQAAGRGLWESPATPAPTVRPTPAPTPVPTPVATPVPAPIVTPPPATPVPFIPQPTAAPAQCHPSYTGACLGMGIGDYDCLGGSGDGPNYVRGPIRVVGPDDFGLDRDGDGWACDG